MNKLIKIILCNSKYLKLLLLCVFIFSVGGYGIYYIKEKIILSKMSNKITKSFENYNKLLKSFEIQNSDPKKSLELLKHVADSNFSLALVLLGTYHITGELDVEINFRKGVELMEKGFKQEIIENKLKEIDSHEIKLYSQDPYYLDIIGYAYFEGDKSLPRDTEKGLKYIKQAADAGGYRACHRLGYAYLFGEYGIKSDIPKALKYLQIAADNNVPKAQFMLGFCYLDYNFQITQDVEKAIKYLTLAAHHVTEPHADAQYLLAKIVIHGSYGTPIDRQNGFKLMHESAKLGNREAQLYLGKLYLWGEKDFLIDKRKAEDLLQSSANNDNSDAQLLLGLLYMRGKEFSKDAKYGMHFLHKAADQNNWDAHFMLGTYYILGKNAGIDQNPERAIKHLKIAADNGHPGAQYDLSLCYAKGTYIEFNERKSMLYMKKAADQGLKKAIDFLKRIGK